MGEGRGKIQNDLTIGYDLGACDAMGRQRCHQITGHLFAVDIGQGPGLRLTGKQSCQITDIAIRRDRIEPGGPCRLRRPVPHAPRTGSRQPQTDGPVHSVFRGENDGPVPLWKRFHINLFDLDQRGHDHWNRSTHSCLDSFEKSLSRRFGAGDDEHCHDFWIPRRHCLPGLRVLPAQRKGATGTLMSRTLTLVGLESSCDDTAAAVVRLADGRVRVLSSVVVGQSALHAPFGGVVPEIAARAHVEILDHCIERAMAEAGVGFANLDGVVVTAGPGLIGGVLSGVMFAKGIAAARGLPLIGVNHLAGHALTPRLTDDVGFPYLMLLVSGGHCQFLIVHDHDHFERIGGTIDDAPGEAFDKIARLIGLSQPGGPAVDRAALSGDAKRFDLPRPLLDRPGCDMSFSGLKTAMLRARDAVIAANGGLSQQDQADLSASFQEAMADVLEEKSRRALDLYLALSPAEPVFAIAGGVAANSRIRAVLEQLCREKGTRFLAPPLALCTDNAAMIANAGIARMVAGQVDDMTLSARPRWPLDQTAPAQLGSGKKGAKA